MKKSRIEVAGHSFEYLFEMSQYCSSSQAWWRVKIPTIQIEFEVKSRTNIKPTVKVACQAYLKGQGRSTEEIK